MKQSRKNHSPSFKAKVVLEALKEEQTTAEIASRYEVHPSQVRTWKKALLEGASIVFANGPGKREKTNDALVVRLYKQLGQLKVERDFLHERLER